MIEKLTPEQEALIPIVRDEWIKRLSSGAAVDKEACTAGVNWLYTFSQLAVPRIIFTDSPLAAQLIVYNCKKGNWPQNSWEFIPDITSKVPEDIEYESFAWYGSIADYGWVAFVDYFERIGVVSNEDFTKFKNLLLSNVYDMIQMDEVCVVSSLPEVVRRDSEDRLHSLDGPAISWRDGFKLYYLWGVAFKEDLYTGVISGSLPVSEILTLENMEQRMAALKVYGPEKYLDSAKHMATSERGNSLYVFKDMFSSPQYAVKYKCPSTGRVYVSFVPPEVGIDGDADKAMAWKFQLNLEEYEDLRLES